MWETIENNATNMPFTFFQIDYCPYCYKYIMPIIKNSFFENNEVYIIDQCPSCKKITILECHDIQKNNNHLFANSNFTIPPFDNISLINNIPALSIKNNNLDYILSDAILAISRNDPNSINLLRYTLCLYIITYIEIKHPDINVFDIKNSFYYFKNFNFIKTIENIIQACDKIKEKPTLYKLLNDIIQNSSILNFNLYSNRMFYIEQLYDTISLLTAYILENNIENKYSNKNN